LRDSGPELGLLESQRLLVQERSASSEAGASYEVVDPQTHSRLGIVRQERGALGKYVPPFFNKLFLSTKLEARETLDESLVFTVHETVALWWRGMEVYDADDHLIGYSDNRNISGRGNFWVYDRRGVRFVEVQGSFPGRRCCFVGPDGRELGFLTSPGVETGAGANASLVSISEELAEQPLAKMLLLGAALALAIGHRG
jgi:hypothetical protein